MNISAALQHPQALRFSENLPYRDHWDSSGGQVVEHPTGHLVFYGTHGQRILMVDPSGYPLHECVWAEHSTNRTPSLLATRICLDWGQWIGIKPGGLVNTMRLNLATRPGWESLTRDDLRYMAARSMNVSLETIRFFYWDEDLTIEKNGQANIRQVKDAFYVLQDGDFEQRTFMSCMSRMKWGGIDYLPVVELFLSLLPGTGNATFELIRQLYNDQNRHTRTPLYYRGIPGYPSAGAFRLFSAYFSPSLNTGESPQEVFLDQNRSHEILWSPSSEYPVRYLDEENRVGITIFQHQVQKVTIWDDPAGLSYFPVRPTGETSSHGRGLRVINGVLYLHDGEQVRTIQGGENWSIESREDGQRAWLPPDSSWRDCFPQGAPDISPEAAFSSVLLYPDHEDEISENASQPFILDFLDDAMEDNPSLSGRREQANRILVANCDAGLKACLTFHRPHVFTIWYRDPAFAQKHAQQVWNVLYVSQRLDWLPQFQFFPFSRSLFLGECVAYDWIYLWVPFDHYRDMDFLKEWIRWIGEHLQPQGVCCLAGPSNIGNFLLEANLSPLQVESGDSLPTFKIHRSILPYGYLNPELTVWVVERH